MVNINARKRLANNIIYFRHKNNWSQAELAKKLNSSPAYISQLENAKRNVTFDYFDRIASVFGIESHELLVERIIKRKKRIDKKKQ